MATNLQHPNFPAHFEEVPDANVSDWIAQGWIKPATADYVNEEF